MHEENSFLTLTYEEEPEHKGLEKKHFQYFMKRLRKVLAPKKIRFFMCGEYGKVYQDNDYSSPPLAHPFADGREALGRPHYHALIFGHDFGLSKAEKPGLEIHSVNKGIYLYKCPDLERIWGHGFVTVGEVTRESAAYVARYVVKKINGGEADNYYKRIDDNGKTRKVIPEYITMSLKPGIGQEWFDKYHRDVFPYDELVVTGGKKVPVPKYYLNRYKKLFPEEFELVQARRIAKARKNSSENTPWRLKPKQTITEAKVSKLKRGLS